MPEILIRKVREPFGCLGNMSPHPIAFDVVPEPLVYPTAEHLFQAMRFNVKSPVRDEIRMQIGPMQAKFVAKRNAHLMEIVPRSPADVDLMRFVLLCKWTEHEFVRKTLGSTGDATIIEDCTARPNESGLFWGAKRTLEGFVGVNTLGKLWTEIRANPPVHLLEKK
jgi:predicted NAD-dependent protein-ADP-ribosyltransferase YbiA (DUF1768 family)